MLAWQHMQVTAEGSSHSVPYQLQVCLFKLAKQCPKQEKEQLCPETFPQEASDDAFKKLLCHRYMDNVPWLGSGHFLLGFWQQAAAAPPRVRSRHWTTAG